MASDDVASEKEETFIGPTGPKGRYALAIEGGVSARVLRNIIRQLEIYEQMLSEDEAEQKFPEDPTR